MIKLKKVTKTYNGLDKAVNSVSLEINDGEIFGLLGPNGAGKTTTVKMLMGVIKPTAGSIIVNDISIKEKPLWVKEQLGYVPDNLDIFLNLTGLEYLNFIGDIYRVPKNIRADRINEWVYKFEMRDYLLDKIKSYSNGMRKKILFIGALIHNPKVLILDEPMTALDPKSIFILKDIIKEYAKRGNTVLLSTHMLEVAEKICDRVGILNSGELVFRGSVERLKREYNTTESLEKIFLELTCDEENKFIS